MNRLGPPLLAAVMWLLAGCATPVSAPGEPPWTTGRLSVQIDATADTPARGMSAGFELRAQGESGELHLETPLGTRLASAAWGPGLAELTTSEGSHRFASLAELAQQALGEPMPLDALPDWLAGRPWPGAEATQGADGFDQLGWHVLTLRQSEGLIEARRLAPPAVLLRARIDAKAS